ncbi:helix-turn-helix domain-containing protein [Viscerimonas tarda]
MEKLYIIVEKSKDYYDAFAENCEGVYGAGDSIESAKENVLEGLRLLIEHHKNNLPEILKGEYEIEYKFDVSSFLKYYSDTFSLSGLSRLTGLNQGLLSHYVNGRKKPRKETVQKIADSLHKLGKEIAELELV